MASMSVEDEALIAKFIGLSTDEAGASDVLVPHEAAASTDWGMCLMVRVITDRTVQTGPFTQTMVQAWRVDPSTEIRAVARNCFLLEFQDADDRQRVLSGGAWTFRGDLVAIGQVNSQKDLKPLLITSEALWVQFHNIPVNSLKEEGLVLMANVVGTPVHSFVNGHQVVKFKIIVSIDEPIKDKVKLTHPTLGEIEIPCVYERVARICLYCGCLGHELVTCPNYSRVSAIVHNPANAGRYNAKEILCPKWGAWVSNPSLIRKQQERPVSSSNNKRRYSQSQFINGETGGDIAPPLGHEEERPLGAELDLVMMGQYIPDIAAKRLRPASHNTPAHFL